MTNATLMWHVTTAVYHDRLSQCERFSQTRSAVPRTPIRSVLGLYRRFIDCSQATPAPADYSTLVSH